MASARIAGTRLSDFELFWVDLAQKTKPPADSGPPQ